MDILNGDNGNGVDPCFSPTGYETKKSNAYLVHSQQNGIYQIYTARGCTVSPLSENITACAIISACLSDIGSYFSTTLSSPTETLTV
ncbi:unnamed protein product, partial [Rotaria sp. Silwood1]